MIVYHICILFSIDILLFVKALKLIRLYNSAKKTVIEQYIVYEEHKQMVSQLERVLPSWKLLNTTSLITQTQYRSYILNILKNSVGICKCSVM